MNLKTLSSESIIAYFPISKSEKNITGLDMKTQPPYLLPKIVYFFSSIYKSIYT